MKLLYCARNLAIVCSCLYWIMGAFTVAGCVWILNDSIFSTMFIQSGEFLKYSVYSILFAGCLSLLSAWFACIGIIKRSKWTVGAFVLTLLIVVGLKIGAGSWVSYNKDRVSDLLMASIRYSIQHEYGKISTTTVTFDVIQKNLRCCGADGPSDWIAAKYNNVGADDLTSIAFSSLNVFYSIPESCCSTEISDLTCEIAKKRKLDASPHAGINNEGCVKKIAEILSKNIGLISITLISVISLEIIAIVCSLILFCDTFQKPNKNIINS